MNEDNHIWEQIDRYVSSQMDASEKHAFESRLATDLELSEMVEAFQLTETAVIFHESAKLKGKITTDLSARKSTRKWWIGLTMLFFVTAGLGWFGLRNSIETKETKTQTTAQYRETIPLIPQQESSTASIAASVPKKQELALQKEQNNSSIQIEYKAIASESLSKSLPLPLEVPKQISEVISQTISSDLDSKVNSPCKDLKIEVEFSTTPTCKGKQTGALYVHSKTAKGGTPPYLFSLSRDFDHPVQNELHEGKFELFAKDGSNCVVMVDKPVIVSSITCKEGSNDFTYNPAYDPVWQIPYDPGKSPKHIKIVDKSGNPVYRSEVVGGTPSDWNGESNTASQINTGIHFYFIDYQDGSFDKGSISILR